MSPWPLSALALAGCSSGSGTVADPGWAASPTTTGSARAVEPAPAWSVPTGDAPYAGGTLSMQALMPKGDLAAFEAALVAVAARVAATRAAPHADLA